MHFGVYKMTVEKDYSYGGIIIPGIKSGDIAFPIRIVPNGTTVALVDITSIIVLDGAIRCVCNDNFSATALIDVAVIWISV